MSNLQAANESQDFISPNEGHLGTDSLHIPDCPGTEQNGLIPSPSSMMFLMTFFESESNQQVTSIPL